MVRCFKSPADGMPEPGEGRLACGRPCRRHRRAAYGVSTTSRRDPRRIGSHRSKGCILTHPLTPAESASSTEVLMVTLANPTLRVLAVVALVATPAAQGVPRLDSYTGVAVRILQSNNAGDIHHIIDPTINRVVGIIRGCPHAHNLTVHPDGLYYYCANEQDKTVDVFDTKTLKLVQQIALSERPNKIVVNKKHRKIYAAIVTRSVVDVIDVATHKLIRSVPVHHPVHNTYVTPDDNFVVAGLRGELKPGDPTIEVIDAKTDTVVGGMELTGHRQYGRNNHEVRPMAFEANHDGSTKRMFAQI